MKGRTCVLFWCTGAPRAALLLMALASCEAPATSSSVQAGVVVGSDDRLESFQAPAALRNELGSAAALVFGNHLRWRPDGGVSLDAPTLSDDLNLCPDEPFAAQPAAAFCSGVLIDENLVATAGHCLGEDPLATCRQTFVTFRYAYDSPSAPIELAPDLVFACRNVVVSDRSEADFAIVELERPAKVRPAVPSQRPIAAGDAVVVASHPSGLPLKVEIAATVLDASPGVYFAAATDTFAGSSGGPLFDDTGGLVGLVTRGETDYWVDQSCMRANHVTSSHEQHQRLDAMLAALCASPYAGRALCQRSSRCGDGVCSAGEQPTCAQDCPAAECGDEICEMDERLTCAKDCSRFVDVPGKWTLPPQEYFLGDAANVVPNSGCDFCPSPRTTWGWTAWTLALCTVLRRRTRNG